MADLEVVDVVMLTGQSNAIGRGYNSPDYTAELPAIEYPLGTWFMPTEHAHNGTQPDNGSSEGSIRSAFVNRWRQQTRRPIAFWKYGVGGTSLFADAQPEVGSVSWWEPTVKPTLFDPAVSNFNSYTPQMYGKGLEPVVRGMVWIQGENEAEFWINRWPTEEQALIDRYADGLLELRAAYAVSLGQPNLIMYVPILGSHSNPVQVAGYSHIQTAQQQAAAMDPLIKICFTRTPEFWTDVPPKTFDGVHYSQAGYNEMGAAIADFILADHLIPVDPVSPVEWPADLASFQTVLSTDMGDSTELPVWAGSP